MGILDIFGLQRKPKSAAVAMPERVIIPVGARAMAGGRVSVDTAESVYSSSLSVLAPIASDEYWRSYGLDSKTLDRVSTTKLIELLADLSPDVSRALWDFLRLCNPGWEAKALKPGSEDAHEEGQAAITGFLRSLHGPYTATNNVPADVPINSLFIGPFIRGAFASELVFDRRGRMPLEIATPDPHTIRFEKADDAERGRVWRPFQWQRGQKAYLDRPTFCYVPVDPLPGSPYGRPLVSPALFCTLFLIGLLHDIRRVVAQQGYPRHHLSVVIQKLKEMMPANLEADPAALQAWFKQAFTDIEDAYAALEPDDAYVSSDAVEIKGPVGAVSNGAMSWVGDLVKLLERMAMRALKTMPLLMGNTEGTSEANANRQWEIMAAGIKAMQHPCEFMLERMLTLGLQAQGILADVQFRFAELRTAELLRDEQYRAWNIRNSEREYWLGLTSQEEMAQKVVGHAPDQLKPRVASPGNNSGLAVPGGGSAADPGSERSHKRNTAAQALLFTAGTRPTDAEIEESVDWFDRAVSDAEGVLEPEVVN